MTSPRQTREEEAYELGHSDGYKVGYHEKEEEYKETLKDAELASYGEGYKAGLDQATKAYTGVGSTAEAYTKGYHLGRDDGYREGYENGKKSGQDEGYRDGYTRGHQAGYEKAGYDEEELSHYNEGYNAGKEND